MFYKCNYDHTGSGPCGNIISPLDDTGPDGLGDMTDFESLNCVSFVDMRRIPEVQSSLPRFLLGQLWLCFFWVSSSLFLVPARSPPHYHHREECTCNMLNSALHICTVTRVCALFYLWFFFLESKYPHFTKRKSMWLVTRVALVWGHGWWFSDTSLLSLWWSYSHPHLTSEKICSVESSRTCAYGRSKAGLVFTHSINMLL